jgi:hypothetical protein
MRTRFASEGFKKILAESGFPSMDEAEITILDLHAVEPPLLPPTGLSPGTPAPQARGV